MQVNDMSGRPQKCYCFRISDPPSTWRHDQIIATDELGREQIFVSPKGQLATICEDFVDRFARPPLDLSVEIYEWNAQSFRDEQSNGRLACARESDDHHVRATTRRRRRNGAHRRRVRKVVAVNLWAPRRRRHVRLRGRCIPRSCAEFPKGHLLRTFQARPARERRLPLPRL